MQLVQFNQIASELGVTPRTLDRWLLDEQVRLPKPAHVRNRRYFDRQQIDAWKRSRFDASAAHDNEVAK